jgi:hypothetical protein
MNRMADELTGPGTIEEPEIILVHDVDAATPDEEAAAPSPPPDDLDRELAKHLNVDQLPADPSEQKKLMLKRYTELRTGLRESFSDRAETEKQMAELKGRLDQLTAMASPQQPAPRQLPAWAKDYSPPKGASDMEVLADFLEYGIRNTVGPEFQQVQQLKNDLAMERVNGMVAKAQETVGSPEDWEKAEPHINRAISLGMELDEAVDFGMARAGLIGDRTRREIADQQTAKMQAVGGTSFTPGVNKSVPRMPFEDIRKANVADVWGWAATEAKREPVRE